MPRRLTAPLLFALLPLALAGCGQSTTARREKVVRCTGFSQAVLAQADNDTVKAAGQMITSKYGITAQDTVPMGAASTTYAAQMDPARVTELTKDGAGEAGRMIAANDAAGLADYTKSCVDNFKALGR